MVKRYICNESDMVLSRDVAPEFPKHHEVVLYTDQAAEMRVVLEKVDLFDKIFKNLNMHLVAKESTDLLDKYRHYLEGE